jgi:hypothetical protein
VEVDRTFSIVKKMNNQAEYAQALDNVDAFLHSLPAIVVLTLLALCMITVGGLMRFAIEEVREGRLNPVATIIGLGAVTIIGYNIDGAGGDFLSFGFAASILSVSMSIRKTVWQATRRISRDKVTAKQPK